MDYDSVECSEFSLNELLYMGHEGLTFIVEQTLDAAYYCDPFDAVALIEEQLGHSLARRITDVDV